jgi:hypothetical protein
MIRTSRVVVLFSLNRGVIYEKELLNRVVVYECPGKVIGIGKVELLYYET